MIRRMGRRRSWFLVLGYVGAEHWVVDRFVNCLLHRVNVQILHALVVLEWTRLGATRATGQVRCENRL